MFNSVFRILVKIAPFAYMVFVWVLSSMPSDAIVKTDFSFDSAFKESLHLIEFAILYGLFVLFFLIDGKLTKKTSMLAAVISIAYGFVDEAHQFFMPYRDADVIDIVKDATGVLVFFYIVKISYFGRKLPKLNRLMRRIEGMETKQKAQQG